MATAFGGQQQQLSGGGGGSGSPGHSIRHSGRHTIHPKLSLSAKLSTSSMTAGGCPVATTGQQLNGGASTSAHFQLTVAVSNVESSNPIAFKQDGSRFQTSQRTLKLQSNCKYRVGLTSRPPQDFLSLHIGGSDLELVGAEGQPPGSGEYTAIWNTTGIDPNKKGARQDILFVLTGPGKTLNRKLQTKFYGKNDKQAAMGHRLNGLVWSCELDPVGQVRVADERIL